MEDIGFTPRAGYCLLANGLQFIVSLVIGLRLAKGVISKDDKVVVVWLVFDAFIHFALVRRNIDGFRILSILFAFFVLGVRAGGSVCILLDWNDS